MSIFLTYLFGKSPLFISVVQLVTRALSFLRTMIALVTSAISRMMEPFCDLITSAGSALADLVYQPLAHAAKVRPCATLATKLHACKLTLQPCSSHRSFRWSGEWHGESPGWWGSASSLFALGLALWCWSPLRWSCRHGGPFCQYLPMPRQHPLRTPWETVLCFSCIR